MFKFLIRWLANTVTLIIVVDLVPGIYADSSWAIALAALWLGFFNAVLRPLVILFALPLLIYTFGIFIFVINAFLLYMVSKLIPSFHIADFTSAFWGALVFSVISFLLDLFIKPDRSMKARMRSARRSQSSPDDNVIDVEGKVKDE